MSTQLFELKRWGRKNAESISLQVEGFGLLKERNVCPNVACDQRITRAFPKRLKKLALKPKKHHKLELPLLSQHNLRNQTKNRATLQIVPNHKNQVAEPVISNNLANQPPGYTSVVSWQERIDLFRKHVSLKRKNVSPPSSAATYLVEKNILIESCQGDISPKLQFGNKTIGVSEKSLKSLVRQRLLNKAINNYSKDNFSAISEETPTHWLVNKKHVDFLTEASQLHCLDNEGLSTDTSEGTTTENHYYLMHSEPSKTENMSKSQEADLSSLSSLKSSFISISSTNGELTSSSVNKAKKKVSPKVQIVVPNMQQHSSQASYGKVQNTCRESSSSGSPGGNTLLPPPSVAGYDVPLHLSDTKAKRKPEQDSVLSKPESLTTEVKVVSAKSQTPSAKQEMRPNSRLLIGPSASNKIAELKTTKNYTSLQALTSQSNVVSPVGSEKKEKIRLPPVMRQFVEKSENRRLSVNNVTKERSWEEMKDKSKWMRENSTNQLFNGERNRLEKSRNDIIRRNRFLKNEIAKEQTENVIPNDKILELNKRNQVLQEEDTELSRQIQLKKKEITSFKKLQQQGNMELAKAADQLKKAEHLLEIRKKNLRTETVKRRELETEISSAISQQRSLESHVNELTHEVKGIESKKIHKDEVLNDCLEKVSLLKKQILTDDVKLERQHTERERKEDALEELQDVHANLEAKLMKQKNVKNLHDDALEKSKQSFLALKKKCDEVAFELLKAKQRFRAKEEIKSSMVHSSSQTTCRLVLMRDIAWIRIAEEEVLLSPLWGDNDGADMENWEECALFPKLPVGAVTPVFEVYNLASHNDNQSPSSTSSQKAMKTRTLLRNKRLADASSGSEYLWAGEDD